MTRKYVKKDDGLCFVRRNALGVAKDFCYDNTVIEEIKNAKSEYEIEKVLINARKK